MRVRSRGAATSKNQLMVSSKNMAFLAYEITVFWSFSEGAFKTIKYRRVAEHRLFEVVGLKLNINVEKLT